MSTPSSPTISSTGARAVEERTSADDQTVKESFIGTDRPRKSANVSWGAIFAGVVTFLALTVVLSMVGGAMGLGGASGTATGIWTVIALVIALAAAGYVAGALAVRGGLLHGFLTWATSILAVVVLAGWLGSSLLGTVGSLAGSVANQADVSAGQVQSGAAEAAEQVDPQQVEQGAAQVADTTSTGLWWAFAGSLIGGVVASIGGAAGARSVNRKRTDIAPVTD